MRTVEQLLEMLVAYELRVDPERYADEDCRAHVLDFVGTEPRRLATACYYRKLISQEEREKY